MDGDCRSGGKSDEKKSAEKSTQTMQDFGQEVPFSLVELPSIDNTVLFPKPCYPWNIVNTPIIENSDGGVCLDSTQLASAILKGELDSNTAKIFMNARQFIPDSIPIKSKYETKNVSKSTHCPDPLLEKMEYLFSIDIPDVFLVDQLTICNPEETCISFSQNPDSTQEKAPIISDDAKTDDSNSNSSEKSAENEFFVSLNQFLDYYTKNSAVLEHTECFSTNIHDIEELPWAVLQRKLTQSVRMMNSFRYIPISEKNIQSLVQIAIYQLNKCLSLDEKISNLNTSDLNIFINGIDCIIFVMNFATNVSSSKQVLTFELIEKICIFIRQKLQLDALKVLESTSPNSFNNGSKNEILIALTSKLTLLLRTLYASFSSDVGNKDLSMTAISLCFGSYKLNNDYSTTFQLATIPLLLIIFLKEHNLRDTIIQELSQCLSVLHNLRHLNKFETYVEGRSKSMNILQALSMLLPQSLVSESFFCGSPMKSTEIKEKSSFMDSNLESYIVKRFIESEHLSRTIITNFLKSIFEVRGDSIACLRESITDFLDNLLFLLCNPEFPIAEDFLYYFCVFVSGILQDSDSSITIKHFCIESLGRIVVELISRNKLSQGNTLFEDDIEESSHNANTSFSSEKIGCHCGSINSDTMMLDCDRCHLWFHCSCVGISQLQLKTLQEDGWICSMCARWFNIKESVSQSSGFAEVDNHVIAQQCLLNYLTKSITKNTNYITSRQFFLSRWIYEISNTKKESSHHVNLKQYLLSQWYADQRPSFANRTPLNDEEIKTLVQKLSLSSRLFSSVDSLLFGLTGCFADKSILIRTKVLKTFALVMETDSSIFKRSIMQRALSVSLKDPAISVREAAVELIGKYIVQNPHSVDQYLALADVVISDKGTSVRKRVVKTIRDLCLMNPLGPSFSRLCSFLIQKISDEEQSIRDIVVKTMESLWFSEDSLVIRNRKNNKTDFRLLCNKLFEVLELMENSNHLLLSLSTVFDVRISSKSQKALFSILMDICEVAFNFFLDSSEDVIGMKYLHVVVIFTEFRPAIMISHVEELVSLLSLNSEKTSLTDYETEKVFKICEVLKMTLAISQCPSNEIISVLRNSLYSIILSKPAKILKSAIPCLVLIWKFTPSLESEQFLNALLKKLRGLLATENPEDARISDLVCRVLLTLGLFSKYCNSFMEKNVRELVDLFSRAFYLHSTKIKIFALESIFHVCSKSPRTMLSVSSLLDSVFKDSSELQRHFIRYLVGILNTEDMCTRYAQYSQNIRDSLSGSFSSDALVIDGLDVIYHTGEYAEVFCNQRIDSDSSDAGIFSGMIQKYISSIRKLSYDKNPSVRKSVLDFLSAILSQLRVNPQICLSILVCMSTDNVVSIASNALLLLDTIISKQFSLIFSALAPAFIESFRYQKIIHSTDSGMDFLSTYSFLFRTSSLQVALLNLNSIYGKILETHRSRQIRNDLLVGIINGISVELDLYSEDLLAEALYLSLILGNLRYSADEPLIISHQLNRKLLSCIASFELNLDSDDLSANDTECGKKHLKLFYLSILVECMSALRVHLKNSYHFDGNINDWSVLQAADIKCVLRDPEHQFSIEKLRDSFVNMGPIKIKERLRGLISLIESENHDDFLFNDSTKEKKGKKSRKPSVAMDISSEGSGSTRSRKRPKR